MTIGADDPVDEALSTMKEHKVRRLPVIDGHDLVGVVSLADLAQNIEEESWGTSWRRSAPLPDDRCRTGGKKAGAR